MPKIQIVDRPSKADAKVHVTNNKNKADLFVYLTPENELEFNEGMWKCTSKNSRNNFKINIVDKRYKSDLIIYLVNDPNLSGWKKDHSFKKKISKSKSKLLSFREFVEKTTKHTDSHP